MLCLRLLSLCMQPEYGHSNTQSSQSHSLYDFSGASSSSSTRGARMGVLVTGAWPMSQPVQYQSDVGTPGGVLRNEQNGCVILRNSSSNSDFYPPARGNSRPVSMPPSPSTLHSQQPSSSCCYEAVTQPRPSHSSQSSLPIPCRASMLKQNDRPPTCVSWLKKVKVIKKIQRKMGIGLRAGGISPNNLPPLLFHDVHGENIRIRKCGTVAKRTNSFYKAIAFSDRSVKVKEKVCLKFIEVSTNWKGAVRFGFTNKDPNIFRSGLPKYATPDLTSKPGFWAKALKEGYVKKDAVLSYYVNSAGDIHFEIDGEEKGVCLSGVDTRGPLWALLDVYGNTTAIELVDPRAHLNNSRRSANQPLYQTLEEVNESLVPSMNSMNLRRDDAAAAELYSPVYSESQMRSFQSFSQHATSQCRQPPQQQSLYTTQSQSLLNGNRNVGDIPRDYMRSVSAASCRRSLAQPVPSSSSSSSFSHLTAFPSHSVSRSNSSFPNRPTIQALTNLAEPRPSPTAIPVTQPLYERMNRNSPAVFSDTDIQLTQGASSSSNYSNPYSGQDIGEMSNYSVECVACCERPVDSVFYACGHMCMCYKCAIEYWKTKDKGGCPICRADISDVIRTYKS